MTEQTHIFELETLLTIMEEKAKRGAVMQGTLTDGRYFGMGTQEMEQENALKIRCAYEEAGVKADIVFDYLRDVEKLCAQACGIVNELIESVRPIA